VASPASSLVRRRTGTQYSLQSSETSLPSKLQSNRQLKYINGAFAQNGSNRNYIRRGACYNEAANNHQSTQHTAHTAAAHEFYVHVVLDQYWF
jgi:hypothetical protein